MNNWPNIIQSLCYPSSCLLCGNPGLPGLDLCLECKLDLPFNDRACVCCGNPLGLISDPLCGQCQSSHPPFDTTHALFCYEGPIPHLIQSLKFRKEFACARLLGTLMTEKLKVIALRPQLLIPVPLHPNRYRERGFNQAIEISRHISRNLNIPLAANLCIRQRITPPQTSLDKKQRKTNLRNAFRLAKPINVRHVAIIDDVVTTGATVTELAKILNKAGVKKTEIWCSARA